MPHIRDRLRKDQTPYWQVLWKDRGRQHCLTFHTKASVHRFLATFEERGADAAVREALDPSARPSSIPTLSGWCEQHIADLTDVTDGTRESYRALVRRYWLIELGDVRLDAITRSTLAAAINRLGKRVSPKTVRNAHGLLSAALEGAVRDGIIPSNPARGIRLPKVPPARHRLLTDDELTRLLDAIDGRYHAFVWFLASTGTRFGEATALQVQDVDLRAGLVHIVRAWKKAEGSRVEEGAPKSRAGYRTLALLPADVPTLAPLVADKPGTALVFTTPAGTRIQHAHFHVRQWVPACEAARLDPRPRLHDLRHTVATNMLAAGVPPEIVRVRMGHEDLSITSRVYSHITPEQQRAALMRSLPALDPGDGVV